MFAHGYQQVCVGAIMRLVGVPNERADEFDDQYVVNDSDFWSEIGEPEPRDTSATLH